MSYQKFFALAILAFTIIFSAQTVQAASTLKIGFITDSEYGSQKQVGHKYPKKGKDKVKSAINYLNKTYKPNIVIGGGDYISSYSVNKGKAKDQLKSIIKEFKKSKAPRMYCIGNHDVRVLDKASVRKILSVKSSNRLLDINGFRLITLNTTSKNSKGKYDTAGRLSASDRAWLESSLNTELPVIIFSHHSPIATPTGSGNRMNMYDSEEVRSIIENHSNVVAVFSGHHSINYATVKNGVNYVIINSLSSYSAYGLIDASIDDTGNASINITQRGKKPATYSISKELVK